MRICYKEYDMGEERIVRKMLFEDIEGLSNAFVE